MKTSKITLSALTLSFLLIAGACSNDDDGDGPGPNPNPGGKTCLITQENDGDGHVDMKYEYDSQNRLTKVSDFEDDGKLDEYSTITYSAGKVVVANFDADNSKQGEFNYTIGANGYASKGEWTQTYEEDEVTYTGVVVVTYQYDGAGYLIKSIMETTVTSTDPENPGPFKTRLTVENTYTGGNLTASKETSELLGDVPMSTVSNSTYEYYTDKEDNRGTGSNIQFFLGKGSKNLVKKETHTSQGGANSIEYTYEINGDKQVTKQTAKVGNDTEVTTYTYTCK